MGVIIVNVCLCEHYVCGHYLNTIHNVCLSVVTIVALKIPEEFFFGFFPQHFVFIFTLQIDNNLRQTE